MEEQLGPLVEVARSGTVYAAHCRNVLFWCSAVQSDADEILHSVSIVEALKAEYEKGAILVVVLRRGQLPDSEMRKTAAENFANLCDACHSAAFVVEGQGFWASANRSAILGMTLLNKLIRYPVKTQVFAKLTDTRDWLIDQLQTEEGATVSAGSVTQRLEEVTSNFDELLARDAAG